MEDHHTDPRGTPARPEQAAPESLLQAIRELVGHDVGTCAFEAVGIDGLRTLPVEEIAAKADIPPAAAARIVAARDLGLTLMLTKPATARSSSEVVRCLPPTLATAECEMLLAVALSPQLLVKRTFVLSSGGHDSTPALSVIDVLAPLVRVRATAFVLVHNHPSGDPTPSREDVELTNRVAKAAHVLTMRLVDHLVVATGGIVSFFDTGLLLTDDELDAATGADTRKEG